MDVYRWTVRADVGDVLQVSGQDLDDAQAIGDEGGLLVYRKGGTYFAQKLSKRAQRFIKGCRNGTYTTGLCSDVAEAGPFDGRLTAVSQPLRLARDAAETTYRGVNVRLSQRRAI